MIGIWYTDEKYLKIIKANTAIKIILISRYNILNFLIKTVSFYNVLIVYALKINKMTLKCIKML